MGFQSRQLGEAEKEILRFDHSAVASWRDIKGNQWSAFYLEWGEDHRLNQNDVIHNPTVCLPAAGLRYIRSLPDFIFKYKEFELRFKTWEFELAGRPVFVYVASRWRQEFDMYDYKRGAIPRRLGNLWKALVGNRGNPLQTLELVVVGPTRAAEVSELVDLQLQKLFGEPND